MELRIYLFRLFVAVAAFVFGISFLGIAQYASPPAFHTKAQETANFQPVIKLEPVPVPPIAQESPVVVTTAVKQTDTAAESEQNTPWEFDGEGEYYMVDALPKGFKDFVEISISTRNYETESEDFPYGMPIPPEGYVQTTGKYKIIRINIANKEVALETETKKGISYKFVGKLLEGKYDKVLDETVWMEGRLTKMQGGKKIAESKVRFALDQSCSC